MPEESAAGLRCVVLATLLMAGVPTRGAQLYTGDGELSPRLELQRWRINRARYAPEHEADRLGLVNTDPGGTPDYDVCEDTDGPNDFGSGPAAWAHWTNNIGPLAPETRLNTAAENHARDMAETGVFSHDSPSSNYYPQGSSPYQRHLAEGYTNGIVGYYENIAMGWRASLSGYPAWGRTPDNVYSSLFVDASASSRGHRQAIINSNATEIGLGHCRTNKYEAPYYKTYDYDVQDFGRRPGWQFFTGTIFHDDDGDGFYDEGEGRSGVEVRLYHATGEAPWYDVSTASGNFAVPIQDIPADEVVTVSLVNVSGSNLMLTVPLGFYTLGELFLTGGQSFAVGTFRRRPPHNFGFRDLRPCTPFHLETTPTQVTVCVTSFIGVVYGAEYVADLTGGDWTPLPESVASGMVTRLVDQSPGLPGVTARFYRVYLRRD